MRVLGAHGRPPGFEAMPPEPALLVIWFDEVNFVVRVGIHASRHTAGTLLFFPLLGSFGLTFADSTGFVATALAWLPPFPCVEVPRKDSGQQLLDTRASCLNDEGLWIAGSHKEKRRKGLYGAPDAELLARSPS